MSIPPANDILYTVANDVLTVAKSAFTANVDLPERSFVHIGQIPWDCGEILAVGVGSLESGTTKGGQTATQPVVPTLVFDVVILRCVVTLGQKGQIPAAATLNTEGAGLLTDLWKLWFKLVTSWQARTLITGADCNLLDFGTALALGPAGGMAGWKIPIRYTTPQ